MNKKLTRTVAFVALFAFFFLLTPGLSNAGPRKFNIRLLIQKPAIWISSFWNIITPIFDGRDNSPRVIIPGDSPAKLKPLTDSLSPKPSRSD